jgi:hypothetical protein
MLFVQSEICASILGAITVRTLIYSKISFLTNFLFTDPVQDQ